MKYVLVTGGVISGLGKGITTSSLGLLLKKCGKRITAIKIDPYLNTDAGTMSPYEHGEVFVLDDGGEVDLDLGTYERFLGVNLTRDHNITTGKVYQQVIHRERRGDYLGKTVQVVPHVTDAIQSWIVKVAMKSVCEEHEPDICMIELGGTVGDIESMVFLEALRQLRCHIGEENFFHVHVSLVPLINEQKSKPTQHGIKDLRSVGLSPDLIACRCPEPVADKIKEKISLFCMVPKEHVISIHDVSNTYKVPRLLLEQKVPEMVMCKFFKNEALSIPLDLGDWAQLENGMEEAKQSVRVGIVGKYTGLPDSYLSIVKALTHAALYLGIKLNIVWIEATDLLQEGETSVLCKLDGILVPGGFGHRGIDGKLIAIQYARENKVPFFGICLGFQAAVIELARQFGFTTANSTEFDPDTEDPVVIYMPEISTTEMGGTMRLGSRTTLIDLDTLAHRIYQKEGVDERHRHRYEVNGKYKLLLQEAGMVFSGRDQTGKRMEILELKDHPFFLGTQFHPEFLSRPLKPSPIFVEFTRASVDFGASVKK